MPRTLSRTARRGLNESDTTRNPRLRFGSRAQLPVARLLGPHRRSALAGRFITLTQTQQTPPPRPRTTPSRRSWFRRGCERVRDEARHAWCGRTPSASASERFTLACAKRSDSAASSGTRRLVLVPCESERRGLRDARFARTDARARDAYRAPTRSGAARSGTPWPSARRASSRSWTCRSAPQSSSTPRLATPSSCATSSARRAQAPRRRTGGDAAHVVRPWDGRRGHGTLAAHASQHATGRGGFEETTDANLEPLADPIESRGGRSSAGGWGSGKRTRHEGTGLQGDAFSAPAA
jgi:hypothetical protein